jgi:hypothetical protein
MAHHVAEDKPHRDETVLHFCAGKISDGTIWSGWTRWTMHMIELVVHYAEGVAKPKERSDCV